MCGCKFHDIIKVQREIRRGEKMSLTLALVLMVSGYVAYKSMVVLVVWLESDKE